MQWQTASGQLFEPKMTVNNATYWSNRLRQGFYDSSGEWTFETGEGRLAGGTIVRAGEPVAEWAGDYLTDGNRYWRIYRDPQSNSATMFEIDPTTGRQLKPSFPPEVRDIVTQLQHEGFALYSDGETDAYWAPTPAHSPDAALYSSGGFHGWLILDNGMNTKFVLPGNEVVSGPDNLAGVVNRPGGGRTFLANDYGPKGGAYFDIRIGVDESMRQIPLAAQQRVSGVLCVRL